MGGFAFFLSNTRTEQTIVSVWRERERGEDKHNKSCEGDKKGEEHSRFTLVNHGL